MVIMKANYFLALSTRSLRSCCVAGSFYWGARKRQGRKGSGEEGICSHAPWKFITFLICELRPPNSVTFLKLFLGTIWYGKSLFTRLTLPRNHILTASFLRILKFPLLIKKSKLSRGNVSIFGPF